MDVYSTLLEYFPNKCVFLVTTIIESQFQSLYKCQPQGCESKDTAFIDQTIQALCYISEPCLVSFTLLNQKPSRNFKKEVTWTSTACLLNWRFWWLHTNLLTDSATSFTFLCFLLVSKTSKDDLLQSAFKYPQYLWYFMCLVQTVYIFQHFFLIFIWYHYLLKTRKK